MPKNMRVRIRFRVRIPNIASISNPFLDPQQNWVKISALFLQVKTVAQLVELCGQVHQDMNDICVTLLYGYITRPGDFF
jgi:hypothetical protein